MTTTPNTVDALMALVDKFAYFEVTREEVEASARALEDMPAAPDPMNYKGMFLDAVKALAEIDKLLGLPEDGCNDPQVTVSALQDYIAGAKEIAGFRDQWVDAQFQASAQQAGGVPAGWQPIRTAPVFGESVLLWWRRAGAMRGRFVNDEVGDGWMCDGDQVMPLNQEDCTHWMPLPADPDAAPSPSAVQPPAAPEKNAQVSQIGEMAIDEVAARHAVQVAGVRAVLNPTAFASDVLALVGACIVDDYEDAVQPDSRVGEFVQDSRGLHEVTVDQPVTVTTSAVQPLSEAQPKSLNAKIADQLRPFLKPGQKVIWREAFRWHDDNGVLSNHYDSMDMPQLSDNFGYGFAWEFNMHHACIVTPKEQAK